MPWPLRADTRSSASRGADPVDDLGVGGVGLVDDDDLLDVGGVDVGEHGAHGRDLALGVGVGAVDDVQQQVGLGHLLQGRAERLDELGRQRPDEADGVGEGVLAAVGVSARRTVGSRVAKSWFSTSTPAPVSRLSSEDLPALV
jgi:hypothetical protein